MTRSESRLQLVERYCARDDLATYDPYDIWKTAAGFAVKDLFNRHRFLGLAPAAALTLFDTYVNNEARCFYTPQEYPIVRAWAALTLLNFHGRRASPDLLPLVRGHLQWLRDNSCKGYSGPCWGLGFRQAIAPDLVYEGDMPLSTMTPYPLEAFVRYHQATGDEAVLPVIRGIHDFFDRDIQVMEETADYLVTSYAAMRDRRVVNAVSYAMYSLALLLPYVAPAAEEQTRTRIGKLYRYLEISQRADGSWLYSPDGPPFIDCFHSCIVLKNLVRADALAGLPGARALIAQGLRLSARGISHAGDRALPEIRPREQAIARAIRSVRQCRGHEPGDPDGRQDVGHDDCRRHREAVSPGCEHLQPDRSLRPASQSQHPALGGDAVSPCTVGTRVLIHVRR